MFLAIDTSVGTSVAVVDREAVVLAEASTNDTMRHAEVIGELIRDVLAATARATGGTAGGRGNGSGAVYRTPGRDCSGARLCARRWLPGDSGALARRNRSRVVSTRGREPGADRHRRPSPRIGGVELSGLRSRRSSCANGWARTVAGHGCA